MSRSLYFALALCAFVLSSCSLTSDLRARPLSETERALLGAWHRGDFGSSHTYNFREDRSMEYNGYTLLYGNSTAAYLWEADGSTITFCSPDAFFLEEQEVIAYSLPSADLLVMRNEEYEKQ